MREVSSSLSYGVQQVPREGRGGDLVPLGRSTAPGEGRAPHSGHSAGEVKVATRGPTLVAQPAYSDACVG